MHASDLRKIMNSLLRGLTPQQVEQLAQASVGQGRLRPGRDRLLPCQERRPHHGHELHGLRPWHARLLGLWLRLPVRRCRHVGVPTWAAWRRSTGADHQHRRRRLGPLGHKGFFLQRRGLRRRRRVMFLFQMVFMDTTATIPTGAMAERWKLSAFVVYGFFIGDVIYPIFGNWAWGGGWLSQLGANGPRPRLPRLRRLAASCTRSVAGLRLAGAMVLGPRLGKYNKDGTSNAIPGHNIVLVSSAPSSWPSAGSASTPAARSAPRHGNLRIGIVAVNTMLARPRRDGVHVLHVDRLRASPTRA